MKQKLNCLRCGTAMETLGQQQIQLGKTGWFLGDLSNLLSGALDVEVFRCPTCGKMEFFDSAEENYVPYGNERETPEKTCSHCGAEYDGHLWNCPNCGRTNQG